jgi:hypothetical protein
MSLPRPVARLAAALAFVLAACTESTGLSSTPAALEAVTPDAQLVADVGTAVPVAPVVVVRDAGGAPVRGAEVTFQVATGNGSVVGATVTSGADGRARPVGWNLGTAAGPQTLVARVSGVGEVTFTATARALPATGIVAVSDTIAADTIGAIVPAVPTVRLVDRFGNPVAGDTVVFSIDTAGQLPISAGRVGAGNGVLTFRATTDASGLATPVQWRLANRIGTERLIARYRNQQAIAVAFRATISPGRPNTLLTTRGSRISVAPNEVVPANRLPQVRVVDRASNGIAGQTVQFTLENDAGGVITGTTQVTDANGIATLGGWTIGPDSGTRTVRATLVGQPSITAAVQAVTSGSGFTIDVIFVGTPPSPAQEAAFRDAAARWSEVIVGDLPDALFSRNESCSGDIIPAGTLVDDVVIFARLEFIDGPGQVLGSAGPCLVRTDGPVGTAGATPVAGRMRFDTADLDNLETSGRLRDVILHEMGHVLGLGTLWNVPALGYSFLVNPVPNPCNDASIDTRYIGAQGIAEYRNLGGSQSSVRVENTNGCGTANGHWRENVFLNELMTGFLSATGTPNPMSILTIGALADLGFTVDLTKADTYLLPSGALRAPGAPSAADDRFELREVAEPPPVPVRRERGTLRVRPMR